MALAGCGFRPLHQKPDSDTGIAELQSIKITPIADRTGQILRNELLVQLTPRGEPARPKYVLRVRLTESIRRLAIRRDEVATRANLTFSAEYTLTSAPDGRQLTKGVARSTVSFNILQEDFATISSEKNARERGIGQIAQELRRRIAIYLARPPATGATG